MQCGNLNINKLSTINRNILSKCWSLTTPFLENNVFYDFNVNVLNKCKNSLPIVVVVEGHILVFQHPIFHLSWSGQHQVTICFWYFPIHGKTMHLNQGKFNIQRKKIENGQVECISKHWMHLSRMKIISNYDNPSSIMLLEVVNKIDESWITFIEDKRDGENRTYRWLPKTAALTSKPLPIFPCARLCDLVR